VIVVVISMASSFQTFTSFNRCAPFKTLQPNVGLTFKIKNQGQERGRGTSMFRKFRKLRNDWLDGPGVYSCAGWAVRGGSAAFSTRTVFGFWSD